MIVILVGPIKHWWDENWETPQRKEYVAHREAINDALVAEGHLVYRPHEAFKGPWDEFAQTVNDVAISSADVVVNLSPKDVPSPGTDEEIVKATRWHKPIVACPPGVEADVLLGFLSSVAR